MPKIFVSSGSKIDANRIVLLRWGVTATLIILLAGFWRLQIARADYYTRLAEQNRIRELSLMAPRGRILDRQQEVLVDNYPSFSVILIREHIDVVQDSLDRIARGLHLDRSDLEQRLNEFKDQAPYTPIVLKEDASLADIAFVEAHQADLPELELVRMYRRRYPPEQYAAHIFGFVGQASAQEVEEHGHNLGEVVGKMGVERIYNDVLMGHSGQRRVIVDSRGKQVELLGFTPSVSGADMTLTLDHRVQAAAEKALEGLQGAIVALDPRSGDILAMASRPSFNPNLFAVRIPAVEWNNLVDDPAKPLLNRSTQAQLAPGSVFKVMIAAAALEEGVITADTVLQCPGWARHYDRTFRCWKSGGHGAVNLHKAIVESCDVFFYETGKRLGIDRIAEYAERFGLGTATGVDLPSEEDGIVPSAGWRAARKQRWYSGETISVSIGQGPITTTPLQLAYSVGGILSGGRFAQPRILATGKPPSIREAELKPETVGRIADALWSVVNSPEGTAPGARLEGIEIAGKTGTAQVVSFETLQSLGDDAAERLRHNAWFVGASPRRNPEIVVAVLVERGVSGGSAAPLARDVIQAYYSADAERPPGPLARSDPETPVREAPVGENP